MDDSLFRKVEPGEKIEPPKAFQAWATNTMAGLFAGMLFGGVREAISPTKEWEVPHSTSTSGQLSSALGNPTAQNYNQGSAASSSSAQGVTHREALRMQRELMEKRFVRICRGSIVGGAQLSAFTGIFCGLQAYLAAPKGTAGQDPFHTILAGSATAGTFGLVLKGSISARLRSGLLGAILGSVVCGPLAFLHAALQSNSMDDSKSLAMSPDGKGSPITNSIGEPGCSEGANGVADVIDKLEQRYTFQLQSSSSSSSDPSLSSSSSSSSSS